METPLYRSKSNGSFLVPALLGVMFSCIAIFGVTTGDWLQQFAMVAAPAMFLMMFILWGVGQAVYPDRIEHEHRWMSTKVIRFDDLVEASFVETPLAHPKMRLRTRQGKVIARSLTGKAADGMAEPYVRAIHDALISGGYPIDSRNLEGGSSFSGWTDRR